MTIAYKEPCGGACLRVAAEGGREEHARGSRWRLSPPATRLGRHEVLCGCGAGGTQRGSREDEARRSKHCKERAKRATEARSKPRESSRLGLWRPSPSIRSHRFIAERLGLWRPSPSIRSHRFIAERLGLWRPSPQSRSRIHSRQQHPSITYKRPISQRATRTPAIDQKTSFSGTRFDRKRASRVGSNRSRKAELPTVRVVSDQSAWTERSSPSAAARSDSVTSIPRRSN